MMDLATKNAFLFNSFGQVLDSWARRYSFSVASKPDWSQVVLMGVAWSRPSPYFRKRTRAEGLSSGRVSKLPLGTWRTLAVFCGRYAKRFRGWPNPLSA